MEPKAMFEFKIESLKAWFEKKSDIILQKNKDVYIHESEIWLCYIGVNVGREQDGNHNFIRPVLVVKKCNEELFIVLPLTTKPGHRKDCRFDLEDIAFLDRNSFVMMDQMRTLDKKRFYRKLGALSSRVYKNVLQKSKEFIYMNSFSEPNKGQQ